MSKIRIGVIMDLNKKIHTLFKAVVLYSLVFNNVSAEGVEIIGSIRHNLKQAPVELSSKNEQTSETGSGKIIQLLRIELSDDVRAQLIKRSNDVLSHTGHFSIQSKHSALTSLPSKIQLGMNNVPVLDQGQHGTCVTFAVTGAMDAVLTKGDYISQLCSLQLGTYLANKGHGPSGWNGSYPVNVIHQIEQYGIVNTTNQYKHGCGDLKEYPAYSSHSSKSFIEPEAYSAMSELVFGNRINWTEETNQDNPEAGLDAVKQSLVAGDRLVFAVLLPRVDLGTAGAVGKHNTWFSKDSWVLTPEILKDVPRTRSAHEMIITGYDDHATAVDTDGKKHTGLLTLRNSWSTSVGDYGEFYMSYDYFKLLAFDVKRISPASI